MWRARLVWYGNSTLKQLKGKINGSVQIYENQCFSDPPTPSFSRDGVRGRTDRQKDARPLPSTLSPSLRGR